MQETRSGRTALGRVAVGIGEQDSALRKGVKVRRFTLRVTTHHTNPIIEVVYYYKNYIRLIRILRGHLHNGEAAGNNREKGSVDHGRLDSLILSLSMSVIAFLVVQLKGLLTILTLNGKQVRRFCGRV